MVRALGFVFVAIGAGACSYDWTAPSFDAGAATDASVAADAGAVDAPSASDATPAGDAGGGVDCAGLVGQATNEKAPAKACSLPDSTACTITVVDECGCDQVVGNANAAAVNAYAATLGHFRDAGCAKPASCPPSCPAVSKGLCVVDNPDAGTLRCSQ